MARRAAVCETCRAEFETGTRGKVPRLCPRCRYQRQLEASQRWKDANRGRVRQYGRTYHAEHRDYDIGRARRHRLANPDEVAEYRRRIYRDRQQATNTAAIADYRRRNPGKHAEIENRRRARLLDAFVAPVDPASIRERDRGLCGICGTLVAAEDESLDHIVPLAAGGTHEPSNVQLAHRVCNSRKGSRPMRQSVA